MIAVVVVGFCLKAPLSELAKSELEKDRNNKFIALVNLLKYQELDASLIIFPNLYNNPVSGGCNGKSFVFSKLF